MCFCYPWLRFLELLAESELKLFCLLRIFSSVSSGAPLRMYFIKLYRFVLSVPRGYLFASEGLLSPLAATSLSRLLQVLSILQIN